MNKNFFFLLCFIISCYLCIGQVEIRTYPSDDCSPSYMDRAVLQDGSTITDIRWEHIFRCSFFGDVIHTKYHNCSSGIRCVFTPSHTLEKNKCFFWNDTEVINFEIFSRGYRSVSVTCDGFLGYFLIYYGVFPLIYIVPWIICLVIIISIYKCRTKKQKEIEECTCNCKLLCASMAEERNACCTVGKDKFDSVFWPGACRVWRLFCNVFWIICFLWIPIFIGLCIVEYVKLSIFHSNTRHLTSATDAFYYYVSASQDTYNVLYPYIQQTIWVISFPIVCVLFMFVVLLVYAICKIVSCFREGMEDIEKGGGEEELKSTELVVDGKPVEEEHITENPDENVKKEEVTVVVQSVGDGKIEVPEVSDIQEIPELNTEVKFEFPEAPPSLKFDVEDVRKENSVVESVNRYKEEVENEEETKEEENKVEEEIKKEEDVDEVY